MYFTVCIHGDSDDSVSEKTDDFILPCTLHCENCRTISADHCQRNAFFMPTGAQQCIYDGAQYKCGSVWRSGCCGNLHRQPYRQLPVLCGGWNRTGFPACILIQSWGKTAQQGKGRLLLRDETGGCSAAWFSGICLFQCGSSCHLLP